MDERFTAMAQEAIGDAVQSASAAGIGWGRCICLIPPPPGWQGRQEADPSFGR